MFIRVKDIGNLALKLESTGDLQRDSIRRPWMGMGNGYVAPQLSMHKIIIAHLLCARYVEAPSPAFAPR